MLEFQGLFGLLVLIADIWAIVSIVQSRGGAVSKVLWVLGVLFFPLVGFLVWFFLGPKGAS